jgi:hypothetical protein
MYLTQTISHNPTSGGKVHMKKRVWFSAFAVIAALLSLVAVAVPASAQEISGGVVLAVASGPNINAVAGAIGLTPAQVNGLVGQGERFLQGQFPNLFGNGSNLGPMAGAYGMGLINQVAAALGLTPQQLLNELASGKSIADLAQENNVNVQTQIIQPLLSQEQALLQSQVQAGSLTQAQANAMLSQSRAWIEWAVNTSTSQALSGMGLGGLLYNGSGQNP